MPVTAVVGANWGDEGKGRITDSLAADAEFVVRFQGGRNAGHTVINDYGKFALRLLPCGIFYPHVTNVLGPGVALDVQSLLGEMDGLEARGVPRPALRVSERAQVVLPWHALLDRYEEERLGGDGFGSTRVGIAPFYAEKCLKTGLQAADLFDEARLRAGVARALRPKNVLIAHLYGKPPLDADDIADGLLRHADRLAPFVCDTTSLLQEALASGRRVLLEGQLGALRDPDHGIHPWTTSSSTLAGYGCVGAGVPPQTFEHIVAVTKAYSSCVGAGPFVTEIFGAEGETLRKRGGAAGEYGATTGRPRRVGWFDAVATRYGCGLQGATEVALTNLDVLGYLDEIPICTAYEIDGKRTDRFPTTARLEAAKPILETMPGWRNDVSDVRESSDLPENAQSYVRRLEDSIGIPIVWISVGPERKALIRRDA